MLPARVPSDGIYLRDVLPALLLLAIGSGLSYAPIFIAGTAGSGNGPQDSDADSRAEFLSGVEKSGGKTLVGSLERAGKRQLERRTKEA